MNRSELAEKVAAIDGTDDPERLHSMCDDLLIDVLTYVGNGGTQPRGFARTAVQTYRRSQSRARWWACA